MELELPSKVAPLQEQELVDSYSEEPEEHLCFHLSGSFQGCKKL